MTKSYVGYFLEVYSALMKDCAVTFPSDRRDFDRDMSRISLLAHQRGLGFFTLDLPAIGKVLDRSLANGYLHLDSSPHCRRVSRSVKVPRIFRGLWLRVFEPTCELRAHPDVNAILFLRQILYLAKKVKHPCSRDRVYDSVREFYQVDKNLRDSTIRWDLDDPDFSGRRLSLTDSTVQIANVPLSNFWGAEDNAVPREFIPALDAIQRSADIVFGTLGSFNADEGFAKHGPGAVSDLRRDESKYDFPYWPEKLSRVFPIDQWAYFSHSSWVDNLLGLSRKHMPSGHEPPSKLIEVPKTQKAPRLIAAEPTAHQYCQQNVRSWIERRASQTFLKYSISFRDQRPSGRLALEASHSQSHWTIDLSSASDCVSTWLVERMLRSNVSLLDAIHSTRTRWIHNRIDTLSPAFYKLKKVSTQGSAITFPLQTVLYATIVYGATLHSRNIPITIRNLTRVAKEVRIYGDDMIVPADSGEIVSQCLGYLGFKVNDSKTFGTGKFRESCGVEGYDGYDVTPAYILSMPSPLGPESIVSCTEVSNNFHLKGFWHTAQALKWICERIPIARAPVVGHGSGQHGWTSFCGNELSGFKTRWNMNLHRDEILAPRLTTKCSITPTHGNASLFQYFTEKPSPYLPWEAGIRGRPATYLRRGWVSTGDYVLIGR
ncbi:TPA_asm: RNA-directed RNA polymerase [ssRNA phage Gephyllon.1_27]|uniref:RNA-directed RNA polymerase n=2 Tax=Leviviricetes TaxID=2842243 RepID=A0A8S5L1I3_9VIRU|nr:RNA-directed RNA polymerase [ssRNA phage Gephyllon.1_27]QDH89307.1 MAG: RNA-dependent RNA polymerase [Leviviridae sp.]DAD51287.1 TPA_asm: RNA-directed RNA polymerase [ssRNA phage Gephyllon.1_27]